MPVHVCQADFITNGVPMHANSGLHVGNHFCCGLLIEQEVGCRLDAGGERSAPVVIGHEHGLADHIACSALRANVIGGR